MVTCLLFKPFSEQTNDSKVCVNTHREAELHTCVLGISPLLIGWWAAPPSDQFVSPGRPTNSSSSPSCPPPELPAPADQYTAWSINWSIHSQLNYKMYWSQISLSPTRHRWFVTHTLSFTHSPSLSFTHSRSLSLTPTYTLSLAHRRRPPGHSHCVLHGVLPAVGHDGG